MPIDPISLETFNDVYNKKENEKLKRTVEEALLRIFTLRDLSFVLNEILSKNLEKQHFGVIGLRKILDTENDQFNEKFNADVVGCLDNS